MEEKQIDYMIFITLLAGYVGVSVLRYAWVNDNLTEIQILKNILNALLWK